VPSESPIGWATVPLLETSKLPWLRAPLLPPLTEMAIASVLKRFVASKPRAVLFVIETTLAVPGVPTNPCGCRKLGFVSEQQKSSYGLAPLLLG
jgi:hypothetical protein